MLRFDCHKKTHQKTLWFGHARYSLDPGKPAARAIIAGPLAYVETILLPGLFHGGASAFAVARAGNYRQRLSIVGLSSDGDEKRMRADQRHAIADRVIAWQMAKGRHDLPWQQTRSAYHIWLSEIMLQQTQVQSVLPYFNRFLQRFPTLETLAAAALESVLESWAGLGYYARARNLHRCAQILVAERAGSFSADPCDNARLPGIGRSTAAAISVFAFGRRAAILDGNVKRILARCFALAGSGSPAQDEREMWALAEALLPEKGVESYTQGLMDLGATVCRRSKPACDQCPLRQICVACREGRQAELPRRSPRKALPERSTTLLLLSDGCRVLLQRRPPCGVWGGLLSLPEGVADSAEALARRQGCRLLGMQALSPRTHLFTHFRLTMLVLRCDVEIDSLQAGEGLWEWLPLADAATAALPTPIRTLLMSYSTLPAPAGSP